MEYMLMIVEEEKVLRNEMINEVTLIKKSENKN
jgi:hypothetical protein